MMWCDRKGRDIQERDWVKVPPALARGPVIGVVVDFDSDDHVQVEYPAGNGRTRYEDFASGAVELVMREDGSNP